MSTLGHQYDNSLVSNAFGFLRLPMNFQPYDSDADWAFIYSIVFVYAIAAWSIYSKYYPFLSLGRLSFVECFFPALALV
ncbi:hypothetical protein MJM43_30580, partial [Salmonella enterica subsp. enterica serovar Montevideo]|nr:hypothetical protein [Salmonella enterica subsp. enterica serovar Montevideo]